MDWWQVYDKDFGMLKWRQVYEAVRQMRGDAGATQVHHDVKHAMLRGFGGSQNVLNIMMERK